MSATTTTGHFRRPPRRAGATAPRQIGALVRRNLTHIKRQPEMLTDVTIQPVMFVLLFAFSSSGGRSTSPASTTRSGCSPGSWPRRWPSGSFVVAIGLTSDISKGIVDRFSSLPIGRGSVVVARSLSSVIHSMIGIVVMSVTGLLIGWGISNGVAKGLLGYFLLILFGFVMIWVGILAGSSLKSVEAVQGVMFTTIFPITFLSNAFARPEGCPTGCASSRSGTRSVPWCRRCASCGGTTGIPLPADAALPLQYPVIATILWSVGLSAVLAPPRDQGVRPADDRLTGKRRRGAPAA